MYNFNAKDATNKCVEWVRNWFEKNGKGCNAIIKSCQSTMVLSPNEIINAYCGIIVQDEDTVVVQTNMDEQIVLDILKTDDVHYDELLEKCGMDAKSLNTLLMRMEIKGLIKKTGNYYSK